MRAQEQKDRTKDRRTNVIEGAAVSASLICLVHCLALPVLLLLLPGLIGMFARSDGFHYAALALVIPAALIAFWIGYRRHRARRPAIIGLAGLACLVVALLPGIGAGADPGITMVGSLLLIIGHTMNWRLRAHAA